MGVNEIELAYRTRDYIPTEVYRRGERRKAYSPARAAPALVQAMRHLGEKQLSLKEARARALTAVQEPKAAEFVRRIPDWESLCRFLDVLAIFLKAGPKGKEKGMRTFQDRAQRRLPPKEVSERAQKWAGQIGKEQNVNSNKLKRLSARIASARNKWEALASLARFYPLSGVPKPVINGLVGELEETALDSFKEVVAQAMIFFEAQCKGWRKEQ